MNGLIKPEISYTTFDCHHLNLARIKPGPELYLCYQAHAEAREPGPGPCRPLACRLRFLLRASS
jgi:hypothetical protein